MDYSQILSYCEIWEKFSQQLSIANPDIDIRNKTSEVIDYFCTLYQFLLSSISIFFELYQFLLNYLSISFELYINFFWIVLIFSELYQFLFVTLIKKQVHSSKFHAQPIKVDVLNTHTPSNVKAVSHLEFFLLAGKKYSAFSSIGLVNWFLQIFTLADSKESWTLFLTCFVCPRIFCFCFFTRGQKYSGWKRTQHFEKKMRRGFPLLKHVQSHQNN